MNGARFCVSSLIQPCTRLCLALLAGLVFGPAWAQSAGEVEFSRGAGFAQQPGGTPRILGKGLTLKEGDRLTTSEGASAIVRLQDGTRMTIRPNSDLLLQQYQYRENASDNSLVMQLVRGGLRAITGLIAKGSPNAARIQTPTATIGIRGTDFDARLCTRDCGSEAQRVPDSQRPNAVQASAKVVQLSGGELKATDGQGQARRLVTGGAVYAGDLVETPLGVHAVLAFRDDSRMTLGPLTRFRVDSFVYDDKAPTEGRFLVSLLKGSVRALTGLIAKANHRNVSFTTPTATIGIRGTGLDMDCPESACSFFTWLGSIEVTPQGQTALQVLQAGQGLFVGPDGIRALTVPTLQDLPRPDGVKVDSRELFTGTPVKEDEEGLFVFVRDGHIEIATPREVLHLGRGETGFANALGDTTRPGLVPRFIDFDRMPLPSTKNPLMVTILRESGVKPSNQCR